MSYGNDANKLLILEACPGKQLNNAAWVNCSAPYAAGWQLDDWAYGEIFDLQVDGVSLTKATSLASWAATPDQFYLDFFAKRLYVYLDGGDSPGEFVSPDYVYDVIAYCWRGISNRQGENGETISYIPEGCAYPIFYDPALRPGTLGQLDAAIADHFSSAMQTSFGGVAIANDLAKWYAEIDDWYWSNIDARVLIGEMGDAYSDLEKVFVGKLRNPRVNDVEATFDLVDAREGRLQSIPINHYSTDDYANLDPNAEGLPIPILFGEKTNITPTCIDTVNHKYKISQTVFGSDTYALQAVDAVYLKGVGLALTTQYTADLTNGEITILFDPGDAEITIDAKGIKDGFLFDASPFGSATGVYSENVADHLFFVLHVLNEIPVDEIDLESFAELQAVRTQAVAWYLNEDIATIDFNRLLQQTSLYHFLPLGDGTFAARYYRKTVPTGTLELRDYDHKGYSKTRPDDGVFRDIYFRYGKDPTTGDWKQIVHSEASVERRYNKKDPFVVNTALRSEAEALSVLAFYVSLLKTPPTKIETSISMVGRLLIPTDKLINNRDVIADGHIVNISTAEVYVILEARKDLASGRVGIVAQLDNQLAIYTVHADSPHQDVAYEDHSDTLHSDSLHGNSHTDTPYVNHSDNTHSDSHTDEPYVDHTDGVHEDQAYIDSHVDTSYTDHDDVPYEDVPHVDTSHVDHSDTVHTDSHTDVAHIDSEV